jgi:sigma-B regulation protein RsbQ
MPIDVLAVIDGLALRDVVLVAHSVSATIALLAARRAPDRFARLVLVGPSPCDVNDPPDYHGGFARADLEGMLEMMERNCTAWAGAPAPAIVGNPERPEHAEELTASTCRVEPLVARTFAAATFLGDHRDLLPEVATPTLVLQCSEDILAPEAVGRFVTARLARSTCYHMAATGHCPHLTHPAESIAAICACLTLAPGEPLPMGAR